MRASPTLLLVLQFLIGTPGAAAFRVPLANAELQTLLQRFVDRAYLKGFQELGVERDFDHGHILFGRGERPVAILYHTQELLEGRRGGLNPEARNWLQWVDGGRIEDAARYRRRAYPRTGAWAAFEAVDLPRLRSRRTVVDKMLDPALLAVDTARTIQWVFTRVPCRGDAAAPGSDELRVVVAGRGICLTMSSS